MTVYSSTITRRGGRHRARKTGFWSRFGEWFLRHAGTEQ